MDGVTDAEIAAREFAALDAMIRETHPRPEQEEDTMAWTEREYINAATDGSDYADPKIVAQERAAHPDTRACPDCGRPQHYTGTEHGWAHDATWNTWECADPTRAPQRCLNCGACEGQLCEDWCAYAPTGRPMP